MLSPEAIQLLAQMHEEWMRQSSAISRPLETMQWAYQQICSGEDPWTGLGNFSHAWYGYAKSKREALVHEPLLRPEQETEYTRRWAAFCAASTEFLCERYNVPCPDWVHDPYYSLESPWWKIGLVDTPEIRKHFLRNLTCPLCAPQHFLHQPALSE